MIIRKLINLSFVLLLISFGEKIFAEDESYFSKAVFRIVGRAEIINERVKSIYDQQYTKYPDLYYFILSSLEDINGLFLLGDTDNARQKLLLIDAITYDIVCAGISGCAEMNKAVRDLQKSNKAGSLLEVKPLNDKYIGTVTKSGLLESVKFTVSEERFFSGLAKKVLRVSSNLPDKLNSGDVKNFLCSMDFIKPDNVSFKLPDELGKPFVQYMFFLKLDKTDGLIPQIVFLEPETSKVDALLAFSNLSAYSDGVGINNNDTLESQLHYLIIQARMVYWLLQNKDTLQIKDTQRLEGYFNWYKEGYERLTGEAYLPGYYKQLFSIKENGEFIRKVFQWKQSEKNNDSINSPISDDYIFYINGNNSQAPPNPRLIDFINKNLTKGFPLGTAFDIGSGDGRNSIALAGYKDLFSRVIAIDHSSAAIERIKNIPFLEDGLLKIEPVKSDIVDYKYPDAQTPVSQRPNFILIDDVIGFLTLKNRMLLYSKLSNSILPGGFIYLEYHLASGESFEKLKKSPHHTFGDDNTIVISNKYQGKQIKKFFNKGEVMSELSKAGIKENKGFNIKNYYVDSKKDFNIGVAVIQKIK